MNNIQVGIYIDFDDYSTLRQLNVNLSDLCRTAIRTAARRVRRQTIVIPDAPAGGGAG